VSRYCEEPIAVPIHTCYYNVLTGHEMARKPTQIVQLKLRIQEKLRREVEQRAKKSGRSLNGELVALIEEAITLLPLYDQIKKNDDLLSRAHDRIQALSQALEKIPDWLKAEAARDMVARLEELRRAEREAREEDKSK
jgi:hypothetical protein